VAVKLRLRRMGRKKKPIWAVVAADSRAPRDGRFIEDLGRYYPLDEPAHVELNDERIKHWLKVGAQPTDTVRSLLSRKGILLGLHMERKGADPEAIEAAVTAHQNYRNDQLMSETKTTTTELRRDAMEAETKAAENLEAELLEKRKKAIAEAAEKKARKKAEQAAGQQAEVSTEASSETESQASEDSLQDSSEPDHKQEPETAESTNE